MPNEEKFYEYDDTKRVLAKRYESIKLVLGNLSGIAVPLIFCLLLVFSGLSVTLSHFLLSTTKWYWAAVVAFLLVFLVLVQLVELPLGFYSGFVVDHRFNLSNQTLTAWLLDGLKELAVGTLFGALLGIVLYYLIGATSLWWFVAAALFAPFEILLSIILPYLIMPIFYKVTPLADQELRSNLLAMSRTVGAKNIEKVLVADESRRSVRANAMFSGIGKAKTVVLFDTLINDFTRREVVTVVAHELGHYVNKDIWKSALASGLMILPPFLVANYALAWSVRNLGLTSISDPAGFPIIFSILIAVNFILQPISNGYSRILERQADEFALRAANDSAAQASSERRLADLSLAVDRPSRLVEILFYTHPPPASRIKLAEEWERRHSKPSGKE